MFVKIIKSEITLTVSDAAVHRFPWENPKKTSGISKIMGSRDATLIKNGSLPRGFTALLLSRMSLITVYAVDHYNQEKKYLQSFNGLQSEAGNAGLQ